MYLSWTVVAVLLLSKSNAQLMSPTEAVCPENRVSFVCQQNGTLSTWTINLISPSIILSNFVMSHGIESTRSFGGDPGYHFQLRVTFVSSNSITSELQVTAVKELNNVSIECDGASGSFVSLVHICLIDPPPAPSGVVTSYHHTKTGASVNVTWSPSRGADDYIISVTSISTSPGQTLSNFTTADTSVHLAVEYNVNYTINVTAQNYCGSNSTILPVILSGCSPPSSLTNGRINEYLSGSVGSLLTYQCNTGYLPHDQMTSTCMGNGSWIPTPHCVLADCGTPSNSSGIFFLPFNNTRFEAMVTFRCQAGLIPYTVVTAVCGSRGVWDPDQAYHLCVNQSVTICSPPSVPPNAHIISPSYNIYIEGTNISFQCTNQSETVLTTTCHANGSWYPSPSELDCNPSLDNVGGEMPSNTIQVAITAVVCSVTFFLFGLLVGALCHRWAAAVFMKLCSKSYTSTTQCQQSHPNTPAAVTAPVLYEEVKLPSDPPHSGGTIELQENAAYGPI